jgi:hypothetical protein
MEQSNARYFGALSQKERKDLMRKVVKALKDAGLGTKVKPRIANKRIIDCKSQMI